MSEEAKHENIADALRPILREGDSYQVYSVEGEVYVREVGTSVCSVRHPQLYGRLLSLNTMIEHTGSELARFPLLLVAVLCVGLHLHWWDQWLGAETVAKLDSMWFFVLVFFVTIALLQTALGRVRWWKWLQHRDEVYQLMDVEDLNRDQLITLLNEDEHVQRILFYLEVDSVN